MYRLKEKVTLEHLALSTPQNVKNVFLILLCGVFLKHFLNSNFISKL